MIEKLKKVYYCEHCKKKAFTKPTIAMHEPYCLGNEETRPACFNDCLHLESRRTGHKEMRCSKFDKRLHTPSAVAYGILDRYPEQYQDSILTPKHCFGFESPEYYPPLDENPF